MLFVISQVIQLGLWNEIKSRQCAGVARAVSLVGTQLLEREAFIEPQVPLCARRGWLGHGYCLALDAFSPRVNTGIVANRQAGLHNRGALHGSKLFEDGCVARSEHQHAG